MRELETVQTISKLNRVFAVDEKGSGGANHQYSVITQDGGDLISVIGFQTGARHTEKSITGVLDCDLLEMTRDRLTSFQNGAFASEYNEQALYHVEQALYWLNKRVEDRVVRGVLGKEAK